MFALLASPLSEGLFHRAIAESPWITSTNVTYQKAATPFVPSGEDQGRVFARHALGDGATLADLRALDAASMIAKGGFAPIVTADGWFLPELPEAIFANGGQRDVPVIVGTNANEGTMFMAGMAASPQAYEDAVFREFGSEGPAVMKLYPPRHNSLAASADRYITDAWFIRASRAMLRGSSRINTAYQYSFTRASTTIPAWGAHHAIELGYVFGNPGGGLGPSPAAPSAADLELSRAMNGYWVQFARTGNPNGDGLPEWPPYDPESEPYLEFGATIQVGSHLCEKRCDALDQIIAAATEGTK